MSISVVERVGSATLRQVEYIGGLAIQFSYAVSALRRTLPIIGNRNRWRSAIGQMLATGVDAFPMVGVMAVCAGFILAMQRLPNCAVSGRCNVLST
jgi:ABC-type transporter Mla maintaining outer membrane lipid asymmetry permease subunit MlaE